jgi:hypothetical protein
MRTIEATTVINAPLTAVWRVLGDGQQYVDWNPFITVVTGDLAPGSRPTLRITPPGKRGSTFRPRVVHASAEEGLRWLGRLILPGLCDADHEFRLTPSADGRTQLVQRETFRGVLVPLLAGMLEPTRQGFEAMNAALRQRVEAMSVRDSLPEPVDATPSSPSDLEPQVTVPTAAASDPEPQSARPHGGS